MEGGTMESYMNRISNTGIVPVVKILEKEDAYPLAKALLNGGIDVIEVTYRSEHATSAIQTISEQLPDMLVGAGTVLSVEQAKEAVEAGAKFIITPGFNTKVVQWCLDHDVEVYPGVSTASEVEMALSMGFTTATFYTNAESLKRDKHFNIEHIIKISKILNIDIQELFKE